MCRITAYLGPEIRLADILSKPDNGLIRQFNPHLHALLNLAGFGMMAWDDSDDVALEYRDTKVPIYDTNLHSVSQKARGSTVVAHVRGIPYAPTSGFGPQNLHPFSFPGMALSLAHNGDLAQFSSMRIALMQRMKPDIAGQIRGTTDSEYVYATFLSHLEDPSKVPPSQDIVRALSATLQTLVEVRDEMGITARSSLNLVIFAKDLMIGARLTLNFGHGDPGGGGLVPLTAPYLGLWYTLGESFCETDTAWRMSGTAGANNALLISSEPLTQDVTGWLEVPEYYALIAERQGEALSISLQEINW